MPSTIIRDFDYRPDEQTLDIRFTTGRRYLYHDVPPEAAEGFRRAFVKGRYFNSRIRNFYRYTEVESGLSEPVPAASAQRAAKAPGGKGGGDEGHRR